MMTPGFICRHAAEGAPILRAVHDQPVDEVDSGWTLACGTDGHDTPDWLLVNLDRYFEREPGLWLMKGLPLGYRAIREHSNEPWSITTTDRSNDEADKTESDLVQTLTKVTILLEQNTWHGYGSESVWAQPTKLGYQICNVPFYVYGLSYDDIVTTECVNGENRLKAVAQRSGHSTYRINLEDAHKDDFPQWWSTLEHLGCTYERGTAELIAVDVPPEVDIYAVYQALQEGEDHKIWEFEEGHCGHPAIKSQSESIS